MTSKLLSVVISRTSAALPFLAGVIADLARVSWVIRIVWLALWQVLIELACTLTDVVMAELTPFAVRHQIQGQKKGR